MEPIAQIRIESVPIIAAKCIAGRWYIQLEGSWESFCIGDNIESWQVGDVVDIIIRKRTNV